MRTIIGGLVVLSLASSPAFAEENEPWSVAEKAGAEALARCYKINSTAAERQAVVKRHALGLVSASGVARNMYDRLRAGSCKVAASRVDNDLKSLRAYQKAQDDFLDSLVRAAPASAHVSLFTRPGLSVIVPGPLKPLKAVEYNMSEAKRWGATFEGRTYLVEEVDISDMEDEASVYIEQSWADGRQDQEGFSSSYMPIGFGALRYRLVTDDGLEQAIIFNTGARLYRLMVTRPGDPTDIEVGYMPDAFLRPLIVDTP